MALSEIRRLAAMLLASMSKSSGRSRVVFIWVNIWFYGSMSSQADAMVRFFGCPGNESNLVSLDVTGLGVKYEGQAVRSIRCHKLVAESLGRILRRISDSPHRGILAKYAGCYNPRPMRGGNRPSKHSWGAAIDLDPDRNGLKTSWPVAATMPIEAMEEFAR